MFTNFTRRRAMLIAGVTFFLGVTVAVPAHADQYDFVSDLDNKGVYYSSITGVIDAGKLTCHLLRTGSGVPATMGFLARAGYTTYESAAIVVAAVNDMCPDAQPAVQDFLNHHGGSGQVQA
ncbi:DUF732 domain-containing protein [Mycolicibacterium llatzerense]|uniref:DUF732 domain-containing protein n=1 Tax=Mycolicibacterium llatzerense TaxID=280871 RepID=UPI000A3FA0D5|nr:DUF732 domain-containing protein [Mycolicibacterium llatzerense]